MSGIITPGLPAWPVLNGSEQFAMDTQAASGQLPVAAHITTSRLAIALAYYSNFASTTPVAGTRYYASVSLGQAKTITGIAALIGATGGTDKFIYELHDSTGALVATTTTSGVTVGTANTWQQIAFTAPYSAKAGVYYVAVQLNGTTARLATLNSPTNPILTGSATGTFGTGAAITPPTTYTAATGPVTMLY